MVDLRAPLPRRWRGRSRGRGGALALTADVTDEGPLRGAVEETVARFGGLHVVFANAGINGMQCPIEEMTFEEWRATLDTNLTGTFLTVKHGIPHLQAAGGGRW